jgi:hypothetical protein
MKFIVTRGRDTYGLNGSLLLASTLLEGETTAVHANSGSRDFESINGIPCYAFCMYTQSGRQALARWLAADDELRRTLESSGTRHPLEALGCIVFQTEGVMLSPWSRSDESESLRKKADEAELDQLDIARHAKDQLMHLVQNRKSGLNRCRAEIATTKKGIPM